METSSCTHKGISIANFELKARKATIDLAESASMLVYLLTTHNNNKMKQVSAIRTCHVCFCVCVQVREREGEKDNS